MSFGTANYLKDIHPSNSFYNNYRYYYESNYNSSGKCHICNNKTRKNFCEEHECIYIECENPKIENSEYCRIHICEGCRNTEDNLCANHLCSIIDCYKYKLKHKNTCKSHECNNKLCDGSVVGLYHKFCEKCECITHTCINKRFNKGFYCEKHTCKELSCIKMVENGGYCELHKCNVENCYNKGIGEYKLCIDHTCTICEINKKNIMDYCSQCLSCECSFGKLGNSQKYIINDEIKGFCKFCICTICKESKGCLGVPHYFENADMEDVETLKLALLNNILICNECIEKDDTIIRLNNIN